MQDALWSSFKTFWKMLKEDLMKEFKKFKNCDEKVIKFEKEVPKMR